MTFRRTRPFLAAAALLMLGACATPIDTARPALPLPATWAEAAPAGATLQRQWWRGYQSDELSRLIDEAQAGSPDLIIAAERVTQAEIAVRSAGASLFPQVSVSAATGADIVGGPGTGFSGSSRTESTNAAIGVSYEVDLWGRVAAVARGAEAARDATRYDFEAARLSLTAGVANAYFQVLALRMRLVVAQQNLAIAEKVFAIVEARHRFGAASALDLSRQRTTVLSQRAALQPLQVQERQSVTALAILLGRPPQNLALQAQNLDALALPEIGAGIPSTLLTRRPDLASAEAQLLNANANIAAARAALFPTISLTGSAGVSSASLLTLGSPIYGAAISASILRTLFDGDRLRLQVESSESTQRQVVEAYRRAVYAALKEVEDALGNATRDADQEQAQRVIRDEAQRSLQLSELRYREGADELNTLLDAQRTLFTAEDQLAQLRQARLSDSTNLFKVLGGGWTQTEN